MKLSICTPTWNRESFLRLSLKQTLLQIDADQLWDRVEVCISDNGSTDNTVETIEILKVQHPRVQIQQNRFQTNQGYSKNMDAAIRSANGEYVFLNGDDDTFRAAGVRDLLQQCEWITQSVVFVNNLRNGNGSLDQSTLDANESLDFPNVTTALLAIGPFHPTFIGNFILRRQAYLDHFDERLIKSIYPHTAIVFEILRDSQVNFRNFTCINVDDSDRHIGDCSARGTAVDAARVQTEGHLLTLDNKATVFQFYKLFLRSVPRAILNQRTGKCPKAGGRYASLSFGNLCNVYRGSRLAQIVVVNLWLIASFAPKSLLRRVLK
ncbi:glycosyltransferase family 2 protein [Novipirellula sp.]|uniref:glycosyltransferase family 2 protein n=1 Tax=Novipirellula sp. TaxID=2795430 RepID=UPI00356604F5